MATNDVIRQVLYRNRDNDPRSQVLAVLSAVKTNRAALRDFLSRYAASDEVRKFASDDGEWTAAVKDSRQYLLKSPSAVRRDTARRVITHSVRSFSCSPARARKARLVGAIVGSMILADERGWDTAIFNLEDVAALLGIAPNTAKAWLLIAKAEGVISLRGKTRNGEHRVALRSWPRGHTPTAAEKAASASILAGEPNLLARWVLSAGHPAWHYDAVKVEEGTPKNVNALALTPQAWEASVFWTAGLKTPRGQMRKRLATVTDPQELDLRLDAVARAATAAERRTQEKAEYAARQIERKALKAQVREVLASWGWTPETWPKDAEERKPLIAAFVTRARSELVRNPNAPPLLHKTLADNLRRHIPDRATDALAYIRKDVFDD